MAFNELNRIWDELRRLAKLIAQPLFDYITFNTSYTPTGSENIGTLFWNPNELGLDYVADDYGNITIGKEDWDRLANLEGSTVINGDIVSICGATGNRTAMCLTDATDKDLSLACVGMVTVPSILNNNVGRITKRGQVRGLNTVGYTEGAMLYVDPLNKGKLTDTEPGAGANYIIYVGVVQVAHAVNGVIDLNIRVIPRLVDLSDVDGDVPHEDESPTLESGVFVFKGHKQFHGIQSFGAPTIDDTTHVLTVAAATNVYWYKGSRYETDQSITCDLDSFETLTTNKLYYFYFDDDSGTLKCKDTAWDILEDVLVATAYWNGSTFALNYEYHNHRRDMSWHKWAHTTIGCRYASGLSLTLPTTTTDGSLQIESGTIEDEDIIFTVTQQTTMRGWYQVSAGVYTFANYSLPYIGTAGQPQYLDTDTYTLTNLGNNEYGNFWIYATTDTQRPIQVVPTQRATAYATIATARAETAPALSGLGINPEWKLIYRFTYRGNGEFQEFEDYRLTSPVPSGGTASTTAGAVSFTPSGNISSTTVQGAIEELDDETFHKAVSGEINTLTEKTTPVDADLVLIEDSEGGYAKKKVKVGNLGGGSSTSIKNTASILLADWSATVNANGFYDVTIEDEEVPANCMIIIAPEDNTKVAIWEGAGIHSSVTGAEGEFTIETDNIPSDTIDIVYTIINTDA
jgi:hypothetical protein